MSFKALFDVTQEKLREGTVANPIHVRVHSRNQGGFRSTVKIRDFELTIEPSAEGRKRLGVFFGLLPHPPGSRPYMLSGPLLTPAIS